MMPSNSYVVTVLKYFVVLETVGDRSRTNAQPFEEVREARGASEAEGYEGF